MKSCILGIEFDAIGIDECRARLVAALDGEEMLTVVTPNPLISLLAADDPEYKKKINSAGLVLADGVGIVSASLRLGCPLPCRITGIDVAEALLEDVKDRGGRVFIYGGRAGVAEEAAKRLEERFVGIKVVGTADGYSATSPIEAINSSGAEILFVCLGAPRQETWLCDNRALLKNVKVSMALGGSVDVWSGNIRRAPRILISLKLEWLWRMLREPRRFKDIPKLIRYRFLTGKSTRKNK